MRSADITFPVAGETITATLYRPDAADGGSPCVVMGHGFTLTRQDGIPDFAQRFAAAGFAALAFDYRHWGDSGGLPRNWISLREQLADWRAAVEHARHLENIDPDRIAVWGMSMGGGHALLTAAGDSRIAAVIALAPNADPLAAQPPAKIAARMMGRALRETIMRHPVTMPVAATPGTLAFLVAPEALPGFQRITAGRDWRNDANTSWLLSARRWRAVQEAANIQAPVLLQLGERDRCVPLSAIEQTAARAPHAELKRYDLDHLAYFWPENIDQVADDQIEFLHRHQRDSTAHGAGS